MSDGSLFLFDHISHPLDQGRKFIRRQFFGLIENFFKLTHIYRSFSLELTQPHKLLPIATAVKSSGLLQSRLTTKDETNLGAHASCVLA
ncbi:MAG: hypothetical protein AB1631_22590 [Acidobacteriota bacterium]